MSRSLRVVARGRGDIDHIFEWLEQRSPSGAVNWYRALVEAVARVAESPETYSNAAEASPRWNRDIRQALFKTRRGRRYRIIFELTDSEVVILRIRGPGQKPLRRRDLPNP
jgi:plasmid stabilization system protein ParE